MGTTVGTRYYMAPELLVSDSKKYPRGPAVDVWAVGVLTFYILSSGAYPFPGISKEVVTNKILSI